MHTYLHMHMNHYLSTYIFTMCFQIGLNTCKKIQNFFSPAVHNNTVRNALGNFYMDESILLGKIGFSLQENAVTGVKGQIVF